jgi:hypothetical protein
MNCVLWVHWLRYKYMLQLDIYFFLAYIRNVRIHSPLTETLLHNWQSYFFIHCSCNNMARKGDQSHVQLKDLLMSSVF